MDLFKELIDYNDFEVGDILYATDNRETPHIYFVVRMAGRKKVITRFTHSTSNHPVSTETYNKKEWMENQRIMTTYTVTDKISREKAMRIIFKEQHI